MCMRDGLGAILGWRIWPLLRLRSRKIGGMIYMYKYINIDMCVYVQYIYMRIYSMYVYAYAYVYACILSGRRFWTLLPLRARTIGGAIYMY